MGYSIRTHERVVDKFCPSCGQKKGHKMVETKRPFWFHIIIILFTCGLGYLFISSSKWSALCSSCGSLN
jgi:predicted RNA-binding Zn-ribbon protein involved in translation (DUF1610 family)